MISISYAVESNQSSTENEIEKLTEEIKKLSAKVSDLSQKVKVDNENKIDADYADQSKEPKDLDESSDKQEVTEEFKAAYFLLKNYQYQEAKEAFQKFIEAHPEHSLIGSAYYWLGEIYSKMGDYKVAATQYLKGYKEFESGGRAPDNLLKLSESLLKLGQLEQACVSLKKLKNQFPDTMDAIKDRANQMLQEINCD